MNVATAETAASSTGSASLWLSDSVALALLVLLSVLLSLGLLICLTVCVMRGMSHVAPLTPINVLLSLMELIASVTFAVKVRSTGFTNSEQVGMAAAVLLATSFLANLIGAMYVLRHMQSAVETEWWAKSKIPRIVLALMCLPTVENLMLFNSHLLPMLCVEWPEAISDRISVLGFLTIAMRNIPFAILAGLLVGQSLQPQLVLQISFGLSAASVCWYTHTKKPNHKKKK
jgi:hypothetical protein